MIDFLNCFLLYGQRFSRCCIELCFKMKQTYFCRFLGITQPPRPLNLLYVDQSTVFAVQCGRPTRVAKREGGAYPAQLLVLQRQHPGALGEQLHLDCRQGVCGGEVPLGAPAERQTAAAQVRAASMAAPRRPSLCRWV